VTAVVKLGTSIVAGDDGRVRRDVLDAICAEVAAAGDVVVVSSGAIAVGMRELGLGGRPDAIADLQATSAVGQGRLFPVYDALLRAHGRTAAQVLLTFHDLRDRMPYLNARAALRRMLEWGVVPVVNENDTTATDEITFGDNDFLAAQVAVLVHASRLVLLTQTDGVFTADPARDPSARLVRSVASPADLAGVEVDDGRSALGSGGMRSKVLAAEMATAGGIPVTICSGTTPGALGRALAGEEEGTRFAPAASRTSSFKLWLKYAKPAHGTVVVDRGAARALREAGTSLLPVGVVDVRGAFAAGDAVEVAGAGGEGVIGKGIANYSAAELRRVMGKQSAAVRDVLPHAEDEAVHRDQFVLA
jgi:glutamate 5-kinase